jgi:hypothetical protein
MNVLSYDVLGQTGFLNFFVFCQTPANVAYVFENSSFTVTTVKVCETSPDLTLSVLNKISDSLDAFPNLEIPGVALTILVSSLPEPENFQILRSIPLALGLDVCRKVISP